MNKANDDDDGDGGGGHEADDGDRKKNNIWIYTVSTQWQWSDKIDHSHDATACTYGKLLRHRIESIVRTAF